MWRTISRILPSILLAGMGLGILWWALAPSAPAALLTATIRSEAAALGVELVSETAEVTPESSGNVEMELRNTSPRDVTIVGVYTDCGCTVAEPIQNETLLAGETRTLRLHATTPATGSKRVVVRVDLRQGEERGVAQTPLLLRGGENDLRNVLESPRWLTLEAVKNDTVQQQFEIRTVEPDSGPAWISAIDSGDDRASVKLIEVIDINDQGLVRQRRYRCEVTAVVPPEVDKPYGVELHPVAADTGMPLDT